MRAHRYRHVPLSHDGLPHRFFFDTFHTSAQNDELIAWCLHRFGEPTQPTHDRRPRADEVMPPIGRYAIYGGEAVTQIVSFHDLDDVFEFKMRWG